MTPTTAPRYTIRATGPNDWNVVDSTDDAVVPGHEHYDYAEDAQDAADRLNGEHVPLEDSRPA